MLILTAYPGHLDKTKLRASEVNGFLAGEKNGEFERPSKVEGCEDSKTGGKFEQLGDTDC